MIRSKEVELPQGTIRYREIGEGEPIVFVHGYLVDGRLWTQAAERLADSHRCLLPDWPLGAHRIAMRESADLTPPGIAGIVADFLEALDLSAVTIAGNDSGGAMSQILCTTRPQRVGRLVLTNCDSHENFPPGPFKVMPPLARLPGAMTAMALPFRVGALRRAAFAPFAKRPIPAALVDSWMEPSQTDRAVMRDTAKVTAGFDKRHTLAAAAKLGGFDRPTLLAWAPGDRFFPMRYAERLERTIPNARLQTISDAKTFVPLDQPERLAESISTFIASTEAIGAPRA